ncbi:MAG: hypothetical protein ACRD2N_16670 [Vicinamibacterales bacterium]
MTRRTLSVLGAALVVLAPAASGQTSGEKLLITAFAVNMSNIGTGATAPVEITIDRWSTTNERQRLITTMLEKGPDALLRELRQQRPVGRFRIPGIEGRDPLQLRLGWDLRYAWQTPEPEGGKQIVIATDRFISFAEAVQRPRVSDYPFTLFEIRVNKDGEGQGKVAVAAKIEFDKAKNLIVLENFASEAVRLNSVKVKVKDS